MRNIWKGLIVGGLTGAAVGIVADAGASGTQSLGRASRKAQRYAPLAAERMKIAAASASDVAGDAIATGVGRLEGANIPARAATASDRVASKVNEKVHSVEQSNGRRR